MNIQYHIMGTQVPEAYFKELETIKLEHTSK